MTARARPRTALALLLAAALASSCARNRAPEGAEEPRDHRAGAVGEGIPRLEPSECATPALTEIEADCYTFYGQEDRDAPNGTIVELPVAVLEPAPAGHAGQPVFFFPGGPGYSVLGSREYIDQLRKDIGPRTLVVMDHRGFIHAEPSLRCPGFAAVSPYHNIIHTPAISSSPDPMERMSAITGVVEDCHRKLVSDGVAVPEYNSYAVSNDVDEIRRLLGYDTITVFGSSTGSGTALLYVAYHRNHVRAAIFGWPWYNHLRNRPPVDEFYTAKQAFTEALSLCAARDERCRALVSAPLRAIDRTRRALDEEPFVTAVQGAGGEEETLHFDGAAFLDTLYLTLPDDYSKLPRLVERVRAGDRSMLSEFFRIDAYDPAPEAPSYALGYYLAHICNDMGANRPAPEDSIAAVRREPAILGFEAPWLCAWWGSDGDVPPEHNDPVASDVPALAIHGQLDPCCGTRWSEELAATMPNLQIVELQGVGHSPVTACRSALIEDFLEDPEAPVDDSCRDEVPLEWALPPRD